MSCPFHVFDANIQGRDFVVGDIHGYFYVLEALLAHVDFEPDRDRLFCVGDLIDRGPECERVREFLVQPWLHAILGNHEQMLLQGAHAGDNALVDRLATRAWLLNGGSWFFDLSPDAQAAIHRQVQRLPAAMEVGLPGGGTAGIGRADMIDGNWTTVKHLLTDPEPSPGIESAIDDILWERSRACHAMAAATGRHEDRVNDVAVAGVDVVFFGHTPMTAPLMVANTRWIDTGVCNNAALSLATLCADGDVWTLSVEDLTLPEGWASTATGLSARH